MEKARVVKALAFQGSFYWRFYERDLAEGANIQGSREILFSLGPFWSGDETFVK